MIELPLAIDVTVSMGREMPLFPGDSPPVVRRLSAVGEGNALTASEIRMGCHLGTHADAPTHFIGGGASIEELDLRHFYGKALVVEFTARDRIAPQDVARLGIPPGYHILIKTRNSELLRQARFDPDYCYVTPEAARRLLEFQPLSIGFDYYSLDPPSAVHFPAHVEVARSGIPAFVCLDLANVAADEYIFVALPLRLPGVEGIPVRAVLFRNIL